MIGVASIDSDVNEIESWIIRTWKTMFEREDIGTDSEFFSLGGDSVSALSFIFYLEQERGVEADAAIVYENPTVAQMTKHLQALQSA